MKHVIWIRNKNDLANWSSWLHMRYKLQKIIELTNFGNDDVALDVATGISFLDATTISCEIEQSYYNFDPSRSKEYKVKRTETTSNGYKIVGAKSYITIDLPTGKKYNKYMLVNSTGKKINIPNKFKLDSNILLVGDNISTWTYKSNDVSYTNLSPIMEKLNPKGYYKTHNPWGPMATVSAILSLTDWLGNDYVYNYALTIYPENASKELKHPLDVFNLTIRMGNVNISRDTHIYDLDVFDVATKSLLNTLDSSEFNNFNYETDKEWVLPYLDMITGIDMVKKYLAPKIVPVVREDGTYITQLEFDKAMIDYLGYTFKYPITKQKFLSLYPNINDPKYKYGIPLYKDYARLLVYERYGIKVAKNRKSVKYLSEGYAPKDEDVIVLDMSKIRSCSVFSNHMDTEELKVYEDIVTIIVEQIKYGSDGDYKKMYILNGGDDTFVKSVLRNIIDHLPTPLELVYPNDSEFALKDIIAE